MPEETVAVPRTLWDSVVSLFSQKPPAPKSEEPSIKPEEFTALQKERDDYAAKIEAMEAERAKAELLTAIRGEFATEEYGAAFTSLVTGEDAETVIDHLAGMPEKTRAWALQQLRALSAQIDESKLLGEKGSDALPPADDSKGVDALIKAYQAEHENTDYVAAYEAVKAENPNLFAVVGRKTAKKE